MEFQFGAANGLMERNQEMGIVWNDFAAWIGALPFQYTQLRIRAYANGVDGVAGTDLLINGHPEYRDGYIGRILVDIPRFLPLVAERRHLTLLHECCHLSSFIGTLRRTYEAKLAVIVRHGIANPNGPAVLDDFGQSKSRIARGLADQILEFDAERILRTEYARHVDARAEYFLEMRRQSLQAQHWLGYRESLRPYRLLLEWLRLALGEWMSTAQSALTELQALRCQVENELAGYPTATARVTRLRDALQPTALQDGFEATAHDLYNHVVDEVMAVPAN
jgi:hypothetical protein